MRLHIATVLLALTAAVSAPSVIPTRQYIQTCTGIGTPKLTCTFVPLTPIQIPGPPGPAGAAGQPGAVGPQGPQGLRVSKVLKA